MTPFWMVCQPGQSGLSFLQSTLVTTWMAIGSGVTVGALASGKATGAKPRKPFSSLPLE